MTLIRKFRKLVEGSSKSSHERSEERAGPEIVPLGSAIELTSDYNGSQTSDGPRWAAKNPGDKFTH
jgi:hypothetical protein